jgi:copper transporter 1
MFAGSCIGVILLVIALEGLRRAQREFDTYGKRKKKMMKPVDSDDTALLVSCIDKSLDINTRTVSSSSSMTASSAIGRRSGRLGRQLIRALLHMITFGVAYFIMLMAMYYNGRSMTLLKQIEADSLLGYIIICILIGAFLGSFLFTWDQLDTEDAGLADACETTVCCG